MLKKLYLFALFISVIISACSCASDGADKETVSRVKVSDIKEESTDNDTDTDAADDEENDVDNDVDNTGESTNLHTDNYFEGEVTEEVRVIVDGKEITPQDNNGNELEIIIHDGTVYLPVKTVADATGKAYYWDGPNYTVYLGNVEGNLEYPTVELHNITNIGDDSFRNVDNLIDNYDNTYSYAARCISLSEKHSIRC